jgi:group I intron endonuclease
MQVYLITNKVNGKKYVGQTIRTLNKRWNSHVMSARNGTKYAITNAIRKYGERSFSVKTLYKCKTRKQMNRLEIFYIRKLKTLYPLGYNLTPGGNSPILTEESKRKMSKAKLGRHVSPKTEIKTGQRISPSTEFKKNKRPSPSTEFKPGHKTWNKDIRMCVGADNPFFGKHHSAESKRKMRKAHLGKPAPWKTGWHHGNGYAYGRKKCRCEVCREWKRTNR